MNAQRYDHLIHAMYGGVMAAGGWHDVLAELRLLNNSEQSALLVWNERSSIDLAGQTDPAQRIDLEFDVVRDDAHKPSAARIVVGQWYFDARTLGASSMLSHKFYREFWRSHGLQSVMWTPLIAAGPVHATLLFQRELHRPPFEIDDAQPIEPLLPHLIAAVKLRWRFEDLSRMAQMGQHMLDRMQSPVLVINAKAHILFANIAARDWLSHARHPFSHQSALQQLLHLASQICGASPVPMASMKIDSEGQGAPATYLVGFSLREDHPMAQGWSQPIGIVVVHDAATRHTPWPELLRQLFGLTPAECRLVERLSDYHCINEAADTLAIGRETVRTQLKAIFQKTGSRNQSALMQLVTELSQLR